MKYFHLMANGVVCSLLLVVPTCLPDSGVCAQSSSQAVATTVSVCELLSSPIKYSGAMVYVSGSVSSWDHGVKISDKRCPQTLLIEWPDVVTPRPPFAVVQNDEYKKFEDALYSDKPGSVKPRLRIEARIEGRFDYVLHKDKDGRYTRSANGFGHLNASTARLVIKAVSDVKTFPGPRSSGLIR